MHNYKSISSIGFVQVLGQFITRCIHATICISDRSVPRAWPRIAQIIVEPTTQNQDYNFQTPTSSWQDEGGVSAGYSYLVFDHAQNNAFYNRSGPYIDVNADVPIRSLNLPIIIGIGITASGYFASSGYYGFEDLYSRVDLISLEPRIALPITLLGDQDGGLFVMPRIGAGVMFDDYSVQTPFDTTDYHTGVAFEVRPSIELGYRWRLATFALEGSYMAAWGSFGAFGTVAEELRAGLVFSYRF